MVVQLTEQFLRKTGSIVAYHNIRQVPAIHLQGPCIDPDLQCSVLGHTVFHTIFNQSQTADRRYLHHPDALIHADMYLCPAAFYAPMQFNIVLAHLHLFFQRDQIALLIEHIPQMSA